MFMYSNSLSILCQTRRSRGRISPSPSLAFGKRRRDNSWLRSSLIAALNCLFPTAAAQAATLPIPAPGINIASISSQTLSALSAWNFTGSGSLNWRLVGPKKPEFETQIQDEVYLADMYFGVYGPALDNVPFWMEFNIPTGSQGTPSLYQLYVQYNRFEDWNFQLGKFLVPFGRYNELYRPDMFLTVTRPLLYASPDSLDLVVRINSPRPPFSSGYTDIGGRVSYYPPGDHEALPSEVTFFVVNGLGESSNIQRTFPSPSNLGIPAAPANGTEIDFGHQNNNLADNNDNKVPGARIVYSLGTLRLPWPIPEGKRDLTGMTVGFSAMGGQYDLASQLNYQVYGVDASFEYQGFNISAEYSYSSTEFKSPIEVVPSSTTLTNNFATDTEINQGYFVQASYPILRHPTWGKRLTGVVVYNQLFHRGPQLDLDLNQTVNGTTYSSIAAYNTLAPRVSTRIDKATVALNYQMTDHFVTKLEYSYWSLGRASTLPTTDIYQGAMSFVVSF